MNPEFVIFHPNHGRYGMELYFAGEGEGAISGLPLTTTSLTRAQRFKSAADAYAEASKWEKFQWWRVGKRICVGAR